MDTQFENQVTLKQELRTVLLQVWAAWYFNAA